MRQKRAKTYRKLMSLYSLTFGFRQPYQILVDSEFCKELRTANVDVMKQLSTVLQGTVKPMITQCCIYELYLQGREQQPAVDIAKMFERRKCNHREAIPGDDCLSEVVGAMNKHRYVIATQSQPLRTKLRTIPAVPIVHINRSVMILEPPSEATIEAKEKAEEQGQRPTTKEASKLEEERDLHAPDEPPRKKRKGPKQPNPLSMKKKQAKPDTRQGQRSTTRSADGAAKQVTSHAEAGSEITEKVGAGSVPIQSPLAAVGNVQSTRGHKRKRKRKASDHAEQTDRPERVHSDSD